MAQVPLISGSRNLRRLVRADAIAPLRAAFDRDRRARLLGEPPSTIPIVGPDATPCALPPADAHEWFTATAAKRGAPWRNEVTLRSVEMFGEYEPGGYVEQIGPTPLLMIVGATDHLAVTDLALDAFRAARDPKRLVLLDGGHFDAYYDEFSKASAAARDWFVENLRAGK